MNVNHQILIQSTYKDFNSKEGVLTIIYVEFSVDWKF